MAHCAQRCHSWVLCRVPILVTRVPRRVLALRLVSLAFVVVALGNAYWGYTHPPPEPPCDVVAKDASKPDSKEPVDHGTINPWIFVIGAVGIAAIGRVAARPVS